MQEESFSNANLDSRFYIDNENFEYLKKLGISSYIIDNVSLGKILRDYEDGLYSLDRAIPYRALVNPNDAQIQEEYRVYCERSRNQVGTDNRSIDALRHLYTRLLETPYDIRKGAIVIDQFNIILEGQHRCCVLLAQHGAQYEIPVVRVFRRLRNPRTWLRLLRRTLLGR